MKFIKLIPIIFTALFTGSVLAAPAYVIGEVNVTNQAGMQEYRAGFMDSLKPYGGKVVLKATKPEMLEGDSNGVVSIIEFENAEQAQAWYHSDFYQKINKSRKDSSTSRVLIVEATETK
ncbi:DUF1330 domain-containing protein [Lonepinella koalarum]|uniref:DUF1330 domain-containing protein n=1 Tax=Lonepinella koalarum TaxID=53417 RepID=UPI0011E47F69|nr:DUF1330 domain-containing protein [Lonepinella koalarum]TYG34688.1 DUF1330 domain-containing protein [Lonepinella koalarum]